MHRPCAGPSISSICWVLLILFFFLAFQNAGFFALLGKLFCCWNYTASCEDKAEPAKLQMELDLALACMTKRERCQDVSRWKSSALQY